MKKLEERNIEVTGRKPQQKRKKTRIKKKEKVDEKEILTSGWKSAEKKEESCHKILMKSTSDKSKMFPIR